MVYTDIQIERVVSNHFPATVSAQVNGLGGNELDNAIIESIAYDQSTRLFLLEKEKTLSLGMSPDQIANLSEFLNTLDYEDTETLIKL